MKTKGKNPSYIIDPRTGKPIPKNRKAYRIESKKASMLNDSKKGGSNATIDKHKQKDKNRAGKKLERNSRSIAVALKRIKSFRRRRLYRKGDSA